MGLRAFGTPSNVCLSARDHKAKSNTDVIATCGGEDEENSGEKDAAAQPTTSTLLWYTSCSLVILFSVNKSSAAARSNDTERRFSPSNGGRWLCCTGGRQAVWKWPSGAYHVNKIPSDLSHYI